MRFTNLDIYTLMDSVTTEFKQQLHTAIETSFEFEEIIEEIDKITEKYLSLWQKLESYDD